MLNFTETLIKHGYDLIVTEETSTLEKDKMYSLWESNDRVVVARRADGRWARIHGHWTTDHRSIDMREQIISEEEYRKVVAEKGPAIVAADWTRQNNEYKESQRIAAAESARFWKEVNAGAPPCPRCNRTLVHRTRNRDGGHFWGCADFPKCKGTANMDPGVAASIAEHWARRPLI